MIPRRLARRPSVLARTPIQLSRRIPGQFIKACRRPSPKDAGYKSTESAPESRGVNNEVFTPGKLEKLGVLVLLGLLGAVLTSSWTRLSQWLDRQKPFGDPEEYLSTTVKQLKAHFHEESPEIEQQVEALRRQALRYSMFIIGGRGAIEKAFADLKLLRNSDMEDVDKVVKHAYSVLHRASKGDDVSRIVVGTWNTLSRLFFKLGIISSGFKKSVVDDYPEIKARLGHSFQQLRQARNDLRGQDQETVMEAVRAVEELVHDGCDDKSLKKMRVDVTEALQELKPLHDQIWRQQFEAILPMLIENREVKAIVDRDILVLRSSNLTITFKKIRESLLSGSTERLKIYTHTLRLPSDKPAIIYCGPDAAPYPDSFLALRKWMDELLIWDDIVESLKIFRRGSSNPCIHDWWMIYGLKQTGDHRNGEVFISFFLAELLFAQTSTLLNEQYMDHRHSMIPMQLAEASHNGSWYGVRDFVQRRRIQNRLAQRARRRRLTGRDGSGKQRTRLPNEHQPLELVPIRDSPSPTSSTTVSKSGPMLSLSGDEPDGEATINNTLAPAIERSSLTGLQYAAFSLPSTPQDTLVTSVPLTLYTALFQNGEMLGLKCGIIIPQKSPM
ncbi:hypothetical protein PRZ48_009152 [Zasmidium cellare]|uniref:Uncharacterized protein n=1 Tax=Zasmidium cellare TaxID=395010 RepID=A0ABR0EB00_ZASCE|nr:hypothetical protein PRZ48_009152 [Zasmidium cellare]